MSGWFKLWPERVLTPDFFLLSPPARSSYLCAFVHAARSREKGYAMLVSELALITGLPVQRQRLALMELTGRGMIELDGEVIRLPLYDEMQRPKSNAERQQKWRKRNGSVTLFAPDDVTENNGAVTTEDIDTPTDSVLLVSNTPSSGGSAGAATVAWAEKIRTESDGLGDLDLAALSPAQRFILARRHALEFANCTRSEGQNAARARSIAAGIANLTDRLNRDRVDVSVRDYLAAARLLWRRGGAAPHYAPYEVYAELVEAKPQ